MSQLYCIRFIYFLMLNHKKRGPRPNMILTQTEGPSVWERPANEIPCPKIDYVVKKEVYLHN